MKGRGKTSEEQGMKTVYEAIFRVAGMVLLFLGSVGTMFGQSSMDALGEGFKMPPNSAKPRVWWHWMNGNITKEGIKLDLEWMNRVGIGGFQNFDAALGTPKLVDKRLVYMTPEWKDAFRYTTRLADQLGSKKPSQVPQVGASLAARGSNPLRR